MIESPAGLQFNSPPIAKLKLIVIDDSIEDIDQLQVGDCWYVPLDAPLDAEGYKFWYNRAAHRTVLSANYFGQNTHRQPLIVLVPGRHPFCVDAMCYSSDKGGYYGGWSVTGDHTNLTVGPSVNVGGTWHGWIQHGYVTKDVDGLVYDENWDRVYGP